MGVDFLLDFLFWGFLGFCWVCYFDFVSCLFGIVLGFWCLNFGFPVLMFLTVEVLFGFDVRPYFTEFVSFVNFRCLGSFGIRVF